MAGYQESRERESCGADFRQWKKAKLAVQSAVRARSARDTMAAEGLQRALGEDDYQDELNGYDKGNIHIGMAINWV